MINDHETDFFKDLKGEQEHLTVLRNLFTDC
jgi:hypothetical protein